MITVAGMPAHEFAVRVPVTTLWESPDLVQPVDEPMLTDAPDAADWVAALSDDDRRALVPRVLTQLLLGEPVEIIDEDGDWVRVCAPWQPSSRDGRGYPGWIPRAHVASRPATHSHEVVVTAMTARVFEDADLVIPSGHATYATILPLHDQTPESLAVHLPGGEIGWLDVTACLVRTTPTDRDPSEVDRGALLTEARRFTDLRYLWGGMSAHGLDCSSLVHITYRRLGAVVPRDASDQAAATTPVPRGDARRGDLLFFQREGKSIHHVAFALDDSSRLLHAANFLAVVEEPMNADRRATVLDNAGRFAHAN
jgi:gamma-D-glutamyl-L-lysine dipeptidyl-peptidase